MSLLLRLREWLLPLPPKQVQLTMIPGMPEPEVPTPTDSRTPEAKARERRRRWMQQLQQRREALFEAGIHPATGAPLRGEGTCGQCVFLTYHGHKKRYYKCANPAAEVTHGPKTDIRLKWPACTLFEERA